MSIRKWVVEDKKSKWQIIDQSILNYNYKAHRKNKTIYSTTKIEQYSTDSS